MLKAIYLNDNDDKELIEFISNYNLHSYKDKTFNTESELIKFLIQQGYNTIINPSVTNNNEDLILNINNKIEELKSNTLTDLNYQLIENNNELNKQLLNNNNQLISSLINLFAQFVNNPIYIQPHENIQPIYQQKNIQSQPIKSNNIQQTILPEENMSINLSPDKINIENNNTSNTDSFLANLIANSTR